MWALLTDRLNRRLGNPRGRQVRERVAAADTVGHKTEAANRVEARAIEERPGLRLRISPRPVPSPDRLALVEQAEPKEAAGGPLQDDLSPPAACAVHPVAAAMERATFVNIRK